MIKKKKIWLWAGWMASYLHLDLYQHMWMGGGQMTPLTAENSQFLWSGAQEAALVMFPLRLEFSKFTCFSNLRRKHICW